MADLNKYYLIGRLTRDVELKRTNGGMAVATLSVATSNKWKDKSGESREETLFIDVKVWDRQAENCAQYLHKASQIHVEGSLRIESWDDKTTGEKRSKTIVNADRVQFLDGKPRDGNDREERPAARAERPASSEPRQQDRSRLGPSNVKEAPPDEDDDGQIPF